MKPRIQFARAEKRYFDNDGDPVIEQWKATQYSVSLQRVSRSIDLNDSFLDAHQIDPNTELLTVCIGRKQGDAKTFSETFSIEGDLITIAPIEFPEEETSISRNHFMLERACGLWTLSRGSDRGAEVKLQRWGCSQIETLWPGTKIALREGDLLSCWSKIGDKYIWILLQMICDDQGERLPPMWDNSGELRETDETPALDLDVSVDRLNAARKAVMYSFSEYLSWPMHPAPKVRVLSKKYDHEIARWFGEPVEKVRADSLKKSLQELSVRLYEARCEAGAEPLRSKHTVGVDLLDELMETGKLIPFLLASKMGDDVNHGGFTQINIQFRKRMISLE